MAEPLVIYVGTTGVNMLAYDVCLRSLAKKVTVPFIVKPLILWQLQRLGLYKRAYLTLPNGQKIDCVDGSPFSTEFSFSRFLIPFLEDYENRHVIFVDSDTMWRDDPAKMVAEAPLDVAVSCVQHPDYAPALAEKIVGLTQTSYARKNWSSVIVFNPALCKALTVDLVNSERGSYLHGLRWVNDGFIAGLDPRWNVLHGEQDHPDPGIVHFTNGTPDVMPLHPDVYVREWFEHARIELYG